MFILTIYVIWMTFVKNRAEVLVHENDSKKLLDPSLNGSELYGQRMAFKPADRNLKDGDKITVVALILK